METSKVTKIFLHLEVSLKDLEQSSYISIESRIYRDDSLLG